MRLGDLGLYFHTLRHMRPSQAWARVQHMAWRPRPDPRPAPPPRGQTTAFADPCAGARALVEENVLEALGVRNDIASRGSWNDPSRPALWNYNLHYFDDLNSVDAGARTAWHRRLMRRWVAENPAPTGIGWHSYPVSRRLINWVKWALREPDAAREFHDSMAQQSRWLFQRMEFHLGGNHLLANAKALVFAGCYFDGPEAARWRERGMRVLVREIDEQVLADGAHFELSPMYHAAVLEDLLDTLNVLRCFGVPAPDSWRTVAGRMMRWLAALTHPDGEVSFFNDSAMGIAPTLNSLAAYGERLGIRFTPDEGELVVLEASGYVRAIRGPAWLACDCAPVGPDYLPAHAHADTLSFELSLGAQRLVVNSGTSVYGAGPERIRQRGTPAHNTVVVDSANSSEVWAGFRVARRARARMVAARSEGDSTSIEGTHDGYARLPGHNVHSRHWQLEASGLSIRDRITGTFTRAVAHFHFHPDVEVEQVATDSLRLAAPGAVRARFSFAGTQRVELSRGTWHPRFGADIPNWHAAVEFHAPELTSRLSWSETT